MVINNESKNSLYKKTNDYLDSILELTKETKARFAPIGVEQIKQLNAKAKTSKFRFYYTYLANQLFSFWTDLEFIDYSLRFVEPKYVILASRTFFERATRIQYVIKLGEIEGDKLCKEEFPSIISRYYNSAGGAEMVEAKESFKEDCQRLYQINIDEYKPKGKIFPNMDVMLNLLYNKEDCDLYWFYKDFSEFAHGNVPMNYMATDNYKNSIPLILGFLVDTVERVDSRLDSSKKLKEEIVWFHNQIKALNPPDLESDWKNIFMPE